MSKGASSTPRVTVLCPTWNAERHLDEALRSIAESSIVARGVEVLLLDNDSTDGTRAIAERYAPLVRISARADGGIYEALNRGIDEARGDVIAWLNSDDFWTADGPLRVLDALDADETLDFAYGDQGYKDERRHTHTLVENASDALAELRAAHVEKADVGTLAMLWRKASIDKLRWDPRFRLLADFDFWLRAAAVEPPLRSVHVPVDVGSFRIHDGSLTWGGARGEQVSTETVRICDETLRKPAVTGSFREYVLLKRRTALGDLMWWQASHGRLRGALASGRRLYSVGGRPVTSVLRYAASHAVERAFGHETLGSVRAIARRAAG